MSSVEVSVSSSERIFPEHGPHSERAIPLSLLDATTANFALTSAIWCFERPRPESELVGHLRQSLRAALESYPQWAGRLRSVTSTDSTVGPEAEHFPAHARRYGRVYAHFGTSGDPGVEFVSATSSATLQDIYPAARTTEHAIWDSRQVPLKSFVPPAAIASALVSDAAGEALKPVLAIQVTKLKCGGFVLAAKCAHPLADISAFTHFIKDWASVSRSMLADTATPLLDPIFDSGRLDSQAAGDINSEKPDPSIVEQAERLPLHRYDWWAPSNGCPWPIKAPDVFQVEGEIPTPVGKPMPWAEWDVNAPVSSYIVHLHRDQVEWLYGEATRDVPASSPRISRHDVVLAHIWSCVMRARGLQDDTGPVHCDLVYGVRPAYQLSDAFMGSPIIMINAELPGTTVAGTASVKTIPMWPLAKCIRETIVKVADKTHLAAHLHSVAYEKSPQRIWQAFLGRRHILVTSWARAGLYDIDFGLGGEGISYADGVVPDMDGTVLIKEAPGPYCAKTWTDNGVDVSINIRDEDMQRLIQDPLLLPRIK
jgi:hypothetical protein